MFKEKFIFGLSLMFLVILSSTAVSFYDVCNVLTIKGALAIWYEFGSPSFLHTINVFIGHLFPIRAGAI